MTHGVFITGPARVFDSEEACMGDILTRKIKAGDVLVIRYEGPRGGPGMREMLLTCDQLKIPDNLKYVVLADISLMSIEKGWAGHLKMADAVMRGLTLGNGSH